MEKSNGQKWSWRGIARVTKADLVHTNEQTDGQIDNQPKTVIHDPKRR